MTKIKNQIIRFCAYRERCKSEIITKLIDSGADKNEIDDYLKMLAEDNFWNEQRFAKIYVRSKFNQNKWGKVKIIRELKQKKVKEEYFPEALKEIEEKEYFKQIKKLIKLKIKGLNNYNSKNDKDKVYRYMLAKGYEPNLILETLKYV